MSASKRILLVEDEPLISLDIESTLTQAGYQVSVAASSADAESILDAAEFDLAIVDFHLRDGTANDLAEHLTRLDVPFVLCSGSARLELASAFGSVEVLPKPFSTDALLRTVATAARVTAQH
jgi:DNA-binding NtrC family response regulator